MDISNKLAIQQSQSLNDAGIVIVHPLYSNKNVLLYQFLCREHVVYVRFDGAALDAAQIETQFAASCAQQAAKLDTTRYCIVFDECDRTQEKQLGAFIERLIAEQQQKHTYVFVSRTVPDFVHKRFQQDKLNEILPIDNNLMLCDYRHPQQHVLEVHGFGRGHVYLNGVEITSWEGNLPRNLFFYLVDKGMATREDIFQTFWPNLQVQEATNVFHVTKRKITDVLGISLTLFSAGFYRINPQIEIHYDVHRFTGMLQESDSADDAEAQTLLERAIWLYQGDFLTSIEQSDWIQNRRGSLRQSYSDALISYAKYNEDKGHTHASIGLYLRAMQANPHREDVVYQVMNTYATLNMNADALKIYARLKHILNTQLNVEPAPHIQQLAQQLLAR